MFLEQFGEFDTDIDMVRLTKLLFDEHETGDESVFVVEHDAGGHELFGAFDLFDFLGWVFFEIPDEHEVVGWESAGGE